MILRNVSPKALVYSSYAIAAIVVPHFTGNREGFRLAMVEGYLQQIS
jgi:hypothetical protein